MPGVGKVWVGPIPSDVCGRTDHLPINVPAGAYVFTADVVSSYGEGNTIAGFKTFNHFYGIQKYIGGETTEVIVAGGEYVVAPQVVEKKIGGGDLSKGQETLDEVILKSRKNLIKTLQSLPGPEK